MASSKKGEDRLVGEVDGGSVELFHEDLDHLGAVCGGGEGWQCCHYRKITGGGLQFCVVYVVPDCLERIVLKFNIVLYRIFIWMENAPLTENLPLYPCV